MSRSTSLVLRTLPQRSYLHDLWAGTKLLAVAAVSVVLTVAPSWPVVGLLAALLVVAAAAARIPLSVVPTVPRWVLVVVLIGGCLMAASGGVPHVDVAGVTVGLGGLLNLLRVILLGLVLLGAGALIAWTTDPADVAPAVARLCGPLRRLRFPVDEWAVTLALALRTFPLMIDEFRTLSAARRLQPPPAVKRSRRADLVDLCVAAMVVSLRRATEMGEAIAARGGTGRLVVRAAGPGRIDALAGLVVLAVCALALTL
ncbi:energy-coupling factor transporter transmembrane component T family protein [Tsukamurella ocularis]|uniref:energy-coupling factor transporter transmembrane component T family protein n=1 Tax=Tsukamurella ocularis TaxID=1970234 RepID=UPI0021675593|nr:energy-coupling factor transporter transmembrane protein EcfT [Tsukamurella ocularis]MCS3780379.1 energy-coupling factor transport system permease protein [Tsukamurella ocularis]MCS3786066.1 energy-coupling factor transport system permease protein [Tsukamurella ocularis]MCS3849430.1 energy-coupling factor transport system permease protein [Tsukamurella ocularis]